MCMYYMYAVLHTKNVARGQTEFLQNVGGKVYTMYYSRRQKKVPPFDPYNGRPLKKKGQRTGIERQLNGR